MVEHISELLSEPAFAMAHDSFPESCERSCHSKATAKHYNSGYLTLCKQMCHTKHAYFLKTYDTAKGELGKGLQKCEQYHRESISGLDAYNTCIHSSILLARSSLREAVNRLTLH